MKIHFKQLDYQLKSVQAVVDCFAGQAKTCGTQYMIDQGISANNSQIMQQSIFENAAAIDIMGFKNAPLFDLKNILNNIQTLQQRQGLPRCEKLATNDKATGKAANLTKSPLNLNIEMETGTGKTYCYIRSMFELNKHYGWSKFIVVVPSIAIREGVHKSFSITAEHFQQLYAKKARFFIYDSSQLHHLESFSADAGINVMIINMQAFNTIKEGAKNKAARKIYAELDEFQSRRPIDVIQRNNPILILDEPQKMAGENTLKAIANFNPLFILRYSATHKQDYNLIYRLDALDAYNQKLVKRISVKGIEVKGLSGAHGYLYLQDIKISKAAPVARLELEVQQKNGFKRLLRKVAKGDDLHVVANKAQQYKDRYIITEIDARHGIVHFSNGKQIKIGQVLGKIDEKTLRTIQIRESIKAHLEKERALFKRGIKVLSLFFIDEVAKYRQYDQHGAAIDGEYAQIFSQQYRQIISEYLDLNLENDPYQNYLKSIDVAQTHAGYFSIDKKSQRLINPKTSRAYRDEELNISVSLAADVDAYDLILKDKESLLSLPQADDDEATKNKKQVRFIFSHSALREGWDNPNVFVICTLKHSDNVISRRQEVGRGLRLAVNQNGERLDASYFNSASQVHQINDLTVVTNESYSAFVSQLQSEIAHALSSRPTTVTPEYFAGKTIADSSGNSVTISPTIALGFYDYLRDNQYIDKNRIITPKYSRDKQNGNLAVLPPALEPLAPGLIALSDAVLNPQDLESMIVDDSQTTHNPLNLNNFKRQEFQALWSQINKKAIYQIKINTKKLIKQCIQAIETTATENNNYFVTPLTYTVKTGAQASQLSQQSIEQSASFSRATSRSERPKLMVNSSIKYDLIGNIAEKTSLKRKTIIQILQGISAAIFNQFQTNPESFISQITTIIEEQKAKNLLQKLSYHLLDEVHLDNEIFISNEKIPRTAMPVKKHVWDYLVTDSKVEQNFAKKLEAAADEVVVYAKLPEKFNIPTPFGSYNPDWAIAFNKQKIRYVYLIAETKGSVKDEDLKGIEKRKIDSAKVFFESLRQQQPTADNLKVQYSVVSNYDQLLQIVGMAET